MRLPPARTLRVAILAVAAAGCAAPAPTAQAPAIAPGGYTVQAKGSGGGGGTKRPKPTPTPSATPTPRPSATPTPAPSATPTPAPSPSTAAAVNFSVDATQQRPISPYIYGENHPDWSKGRRMTLGRLGGNRWTAYNWENNASNAGSDWYHQNDGYLGGGETPGEAVRGPVAAAQAASAAMIVTVPMAGYVAADKGPGGDVAQTPNYLTTRFRQTLPRKNAAFSLAPDLTDGFVYQDEFVSFMRAKFPTAAGRIFYSLDNEPDLWADTHPRIHPAKARYDELTAKSRDTAAAIKAVSPESLVFGPVSYGWNGYTTLQDAPDAAGRDFVEHFLDAMRQAELAAGRRLVDVLDLHWYPEAQSSTGVRVTADDASDAVAAARVQAPRSLWDPSYTETSWITQWSTNGPIRLLPRMQGKIAAKYPGTRLALTEYYYGGGGHISGGIAQADALGVFGREGLFAAALWPLGATDQRFIYGAFAMFRNFDGAGGAFGDTSLAAATTDVAKTSVYASRDAAAPSRLVIVAINKTAGALSTDLAIANAPALAQADVYQLTAASATPQRVGTLTLGSGNALRYTLPAMSVTTLVLR